MPISKCEHFRDILEENALRLTDRTHMLELIPFVLDEEKTHIKEEIKGKYLSIIYDGTSRLGEVLAIVVCYVDNWEILQQLVRMPKRMPTISVFPMESNLPIFLRQ